MDELNNQNMLQVGTILHGTYKIESYLSSGGFGNTYLAKNIEFDETYAIKEFFVKGVCQRDGNSTTISVSNAENTNSFEQQREKFKKEARRLRSLSNPHIVKVYDLFEENGTAYYVMDYVDGENLSARLKRTNAPLAESEVRNYLNQILDGLEAIHNEGMFHLDIKPANIMVDSHDVVKLIDFGASKQQSTVGGATMSTGISYTNGYAPSEQMAQSYDKFGPWTDFYALGATMYKLLTNQDPPSVSDLSEDETEDKHLALPMPNVSEEMKKLVVWMMQVNRNQRPQSVGDILHFLSSNQEETVSEPFDSEESDIDKSDWETYDRNVFQLFSFKGRIGRFHYIVSYLGIMLIAILFGFLWGCVDLAAGNASQQPPTVMMWILQIFGSWALLALGARRCHDSGRSGYWQLIPFYNIYLLFATPQEYDNEYGLYNNTKAHKLFKTNSFFFRTFGIIIAIIVLFMFLGTRGSKKQDANVQDYSLGTDEYDSETAVADTTTYYSEPN